MIIAPPRGFEGQFLLSEELDKQRLEIEQGAATTRLHSLSLARFDRLGQHDVLDADLRRIGVLLGDPVDLDHSIAIDGEVRLSATLSGDADAYVEEHIYALGGRFLFVLDHEDLQRLYLDAGGSLPAVYDSETGRVASSTGLLLDVDEYAQRFNEELYTKLNFRQDDWLPAGLTVHDGIHRLLVNHYLDLQTWTAVRHWPSSCIEPTTDPDASCRQVVATARSAIDAYRRTGAVAMSLTAGNETRLLLAASRDIASDIDFVTVDHPEERLDRTRAQELAARFSLRHRCLPLVTATPEQAEDWHARAGHCVGGANMSSHPTVDQLSPYSFLLGGVGGEIGRGFLWRPTDRASTEIDAKNLVSRFGMTPIEDVVRAVESWLAELPEPIDPFLLLDLAYLELRMGPWAFAQPEGTSPVRHAHPLISRRSFLAMLSLPNDWRSSDLIIRRSIELHWPELLELPINRFGDWRDPIWTLRRAVRRPHLVMRRLRKRFG